MQGLGRGPLSFHRAQPVTVPSTIASVTYDDPNGSWESWEPGAGWNGTGGGHAGHGSSDAPGSNAQPGQHAQPPKNEGGMRWDEDSDTNLQHPNKQLPGTLITMSELDWEDTEELATELWRHPMRPRPVGQRQVTRSSPVRPDPRHLPMPLPGPAGARPHARSEEPTARLRMTGPNVLTRTGSQPRLSRNAPPQRLPAAPPPRPALEEPERRSRTTTQPGAAGSDSSADLRSAGSSGASLAEDWLSGTDVESLPASFSAEGYSARMPEAAMPQQPAYSQPLPRPAPPQPSAAAPVNASQSSAADRYSPRTTSVQPTAARHVHMPERHPPPPPAPELHAQAPAAGAGRLPAPERYAGQLSGGERYAQPSAAGAVRAPVPQGHGGQLSGGERYAQPSAAGAVRAPVPQGHGGQLSGGERYAQPSAAGAGRAPVPQGHAGQLSAAERYTQPSAARAPALDEHGAQPSGPVSDTYARPPSRLLSEQTVTAPPTAAGAFSAQLPGSERHPQPTPVGPSSLSGAERYAAQPPSSTGHPGQLPADRHAQQPVTPRAPSAAAPSLATATLTPPPPAGSFAPPAAAYAPHTTQLQRRGSLIQTQATSSGGAPPAQLPPAPPPRPSLPAEPLTRTQSFEVSAPALPPIESLRERTQTPQRLLPTPPRFQSSAHIPTIIGTPTASSAPAPARGRTEPPQSLAQSAARSQPRAAGRDAMMAPPPPSAAQSQLIEQLQEQLLEAMARARVQEARAAEAEKTVEQAEEQLAAVARSHSDESEQLTQQLMQLTQQLQAAERRALEAERRPREPDNMLHLAEADLVVRPHKQGRANLILSGLLASSLSLGGAAYFMFYAPLQKQLTAVEQLRSQDSQAHATAVSNLQARSTAERQGLEAQNAELRKQLEEARAAAAPASAAEDNPRARGRRSGADADSEATPAGTRSARAIERRMRRNSRAAAQSDSEDDESPRARKSSAPARSGHDDSNDPLGGL